MTRRGPSPARRLRDALEPVAALSFYSEPSRQAYAAVGLPDFGPAYVWSRSSVLGPADPAVVVAAFGVFEAGMIRHNLDTGRRACSAQVIRSATQSGAGLAAQEVLIGVDVHDIETVVTALRRGVESADTAGRPLFAGHRAWAWPADPYAGLWRVATAWRELRGDSHLAACAIGAVSGLQANVLNELEAGYPLGEYTATRRFAPQDIRAAADALRDRGLLAGDELSDEGQALRARLELWTDAAMAPALDAVGPDLETVVPHLQRWARLVVERRWFPTDDRKRAAG